MINVEEIREIKIIEIFRKYFETQPQIYIGVASPTGINEDAGAIRLGNNKLLVVTTDLIGQKTHVPVGMSLEQMGRKAVIVNLSDLAAMGAKPLGLVFSVAFPKHIRIQDIEEIAKGMSAAAKAYDTCVFGGDVNKSADIILAGTAIGLVDEDCIWLRSGAKVGDIVAVTGWIGTAALGLSMLEQQKEIEEEILQKVLLPQARLREALALVKLKAITSAGDITDGLALELHKIAEASKVGIIIKEEQLPILEKVKSIGEDLRLNYLDLALYIGEDFELVLTVMPEKWALVEKTCNELNLKISQIGQITTSGKVSMEKKNGELVPLQKRGFDQFTESL